MSGHSKWSTIKRQKGANDAKRGQLFTKLGNAIALAAKNGGDPDMNPTLAMAIEKAKAANMPNSNIERSIKRGTGELGGNIIEEYLFEGYGPGGVGIIVEAASDNRNRTTSEVRSAFSKNGGSLAESGSVIFQFARKGLIRLKAENNDENLLNIIEAGAEDVSAADGELEVYTPMKQLAAVRSALKDKSFEIVEASLIYDPNSNVIVDDEGTSKKVEKILLALDDLDDVAEVYTNFDTSSSESEND